MESDKSLVEDFNKNLRIVPDFPKAGILFRDIAPVFQNNDLVDRIVDFFAKAVENIEFDSIGGLETRGYLFGILLAQKLKKPFVVIRKAGKLPPPTHKVKYTLEYGTAEFEIVQGAFKKGSKVLIHDDLLATGGSALAAAQLVSDCGATVAGYSFLIILKDLNGTKNLQDKSPAPVITLVEYD